MTETTQTTPHEEWEKEFDEKFPNPHTDYDAWQAVNQARKEMKEFIRETRATARESALREALEALPKTGVTVHLRSVSDGLLGWMRGVRESHDAIARLLDT